MFATCASKNGKLHYWQFAVVSDSVQAWQVLNTIEDMLTNDMEC